MKNIIKFYKEHRIFTILMAIVIVCLVLITTVLIQCFGANGSDKYGNRLEGIDKVKITSSRQKDFENNTANNDKVKSADIVVEGRIIYIKLIFEPNVKLVEAESIALKTLEEFSEEEKAYYDFNFTLTQKATDNSDGFHISGAKNKNGSGLVWNNNTQKSIKPADDSATEKED